MKNILIQIQILFYILRIIFIKLILFIFFYFKLKINNSLIENNYLFYCFLFISFDKINKKQNQYLIIVNIIYNKIQ